MVSVAEPTEQNDNSSGAHQRIHDHDGLKHTSLIGDGSPQWYHRRDSDAEDVVSDSDTASTFSRRHNGGGSCRSSAASSVDGTLVLRGGGGCGDMLTTDGVGMALGEAVGDEAAGGPQYGNVAVTQSTNVHIGNKTYYQGPVTIMYAQKGGKMADNGAVAGLDNPLCLTDDERGRSECEAAAADGAARKGEEAGDGNGGQSVPDHFVVKCDKTWLSYFDQRQLLVVGTAMILLVSLITLGAVLLTKGIQPAGYVNHEESNETETGVPIPGPLDPNGTLTLSGKLKIISRLEWVAQPPVQPANALPIPVPYVIIMHTATENCTDQAACVFHVRFIQTFHIESRGWWDIGYSFLVGGDGFAYEGRGWKSEGAHTYGYNTKSIGIAFIGTFNNIMPPKRQILAAKQLIARGVELGYIRKDYKVLAARQLQTTQSPGEMLYNDIKTWPHWSPIP